MPKGPGEKREQEGLGYQQKSGTSRNEWARRKERPRGLPRGPGVKRDQEDRGASIGGNELVTTGQSDLGAVLHDGGSVVWVREVH
jgi:hypothetical protein